MIEHDKRRRMGGTTSYFPALYLGEYMANLVDEAFGVWPELSQIDPIRFGTASGYALDVKSAARMSVDLDLWDVVLDYGAGLT